MTINASISAEVLSRELDACQVLHRTYIDGCLLLEHAEAAQEPEARLIGARRAVTSSRRAWLTLVRHIIGEPSHTLGDLQSKANLLLETCRELCGGDDEVASLAVAFATDVERLLQHDGESALR